MFANHVHSKYSECLEVAYFLRGKPEAGTPGPVYPLSKAYDIISRLGALHTPGSL